MSISTADLQREPWDNIGPRCMFSRAHVRESEEGMRFKGTNSLATPKEEWNYVMTILDRTRLLYHAPTMNSVPSKLRRFLTHP